MNKSGSGKESIRLDIYLGNGLQFATGALLSTQVPDRIRTEAEAAVRPPHTRLKRQHIRNHRNTPGEHAHLIITSFPSHHHHCVRFRASSRPRSVTPNGDPSDELHIAESGTPTATTPTRSRSRSHSRSSHSPSSQPRHSPRSRHRSDSSRSASRSRSRESNASHGSAHSGDDNNDASSKDAGSPAVDKRRRPNASDSGSDAEQRAATKKSKSALIDTDDSGDDNVLRANTPAANVGDEPNAATEVDAGALFGDADDISTDDDEATGEGTKAPGDGGSTHSDTEAARPARSGAESDSDDSVVGRRPRVRRESDTNSRQSRSPAAADAGGRSRSRSRSNSDGGRREEERRREPEPEPEPIPERRIDVEIPRIVADLGKDIHFVKLPNFLSVDTRPFDPETYEDEIDEEETLDEEGRQRIKLKVSNTMRWREHMNDAGAMVRESNTRMVKWSDGSMSLHLGNEIFDVYRQPLHGDHNHLFIRQGTGLQGQVAFRTKLTFRPHSTESFTHKKMTMSLADRSQKTAGIKILTQVGYDPDTDRMMNLKKEEEKLRQAMRAKTTVTKSKRGAAASGGAGGAGGRAGGGAGGEPGGAAGGEHDSDDEGVISIAAIKNKYKNGPGGAAAGGGAAARKSGAAIYSSDEEDSDLDTRRTRRVDKAKASKALRDSDDDDSDDDDEDEDVDSGSGSEQATSKPRGNQIESDED